VEAQLLAQAGVREAVAVAQQSPAGVRLLAYVAPQAGADLDPAALREAVARTLPDYMVPAVVVVLANLPLNPSGKVDRKALPQPQFAGAADYAAPKGEVEQALAAICAEVLGVERVGRHDNFFDLGGHSLAVMELVALAKQRHAIGLSIRDVFEAPTVAALAQAGGARSTQTTDQQAQLASIEALLTELEI
jgi:acyl carrier protein